MTWSILQGDCVKQMRTLDDCSVDAVVCDPPYGIGFMGHEWDQPGVEHRAGPGKWEQPPAPGRTAPRSNGSMEAGKYDLSPTANRRYQAWCELWAHEGLRVLKPGGHLLASCGTRTVHRMTAGIEDAGFEIRDTILWLYGSGFPKSLDVSKAIDKGGYGDATAEDWRGWGTALKPAHEPIVVARKPLVGTVAANVLEHGVGGMNIDACRLEPGDGGDREGEASAAKIYTNGIGGAEKFTHSPGPRGGSADGRWPANVVLDPEAAATLDEQTGNRPGSHDQTATESRNAAFGGGVNGGVGFGDSGGASRFFYCAKTSRGERNAGLEGFASKPLNWSSGEESPGTFQAEGTEREARNHHPTVKPINLMRWLVRLVTPLGGTVLDPFTGSGSTGCAAVLEGFDFIGCEREAEYVAIAEARIAFWAQHVGREVEDVLGIVGASERTRKLAEGVGQIGLELDAA